jgi:hypothetical protein
VTGDQFGDVCDDDDDDDGVLDTGDTEPLNPFACQDLDGDTCDDCSIGASPQPNNDGLDSDSDGLCNAGDDDNDNDGYTDVDEITCGSDPDNQADVPLDTDNDGLCNNGVDDDDDNDGLSDADEVGQTNTDPLNPDTDGDSIIDGQDNCPLVSNSGQQNTDQDLANSGEPVTGDQFGDVCDDDDDGDGLPDTDEDTNGNGTVQSNETDPKDPDTDGDGILDGADACPLDPDPNCVP